MNEAEVKVGLLHYLNDRFPEPGALRIVEELPINDGRTRADLVAIGDDRLMGFEIKSPKDDLSRLRRQLEDYRLVFDEVTLVIGFRHLTGVLGEVPDWCGVLLVSPLGGEAEVENFREARRNLQRDRLQMAQLLWRDEALALCEKHDVARGVRSKPRRFIWKRLADQLDADTLAEEVRVSLRRRGRSWRDDARRRHL